MITLKEYKKLYEERHPAEAASEVIDWNAHQTLEPFALKRPSIEVKDDLSLDLKYYTNQPIEELLCSSIFNAIYQELAKSGQISEENMKHVVGQDAWVNKYPMSCSLLVKNKALYFMKSKHVNQEFAYDMESFIFRLYKTYQDIEKGADEWICSCVNKELATRIEFKFIIKYGNAGCSIDVPELLIVKKQSEPMPEMPAIG